MEIIILDGGKMTSVAEAHEYLARVMRLPSYYGKNLDALADCLGEFSSRTTVIMMNTSALRAHLGDYAARLLAVFEEISGEKNSFRWIEED